MVTFDYLPEFERRAKALAKRYRSFVDDYNTLLDELERNPWGGTPLGGNTYKPRMTIGGARVITYNVQQTESDITITLMSIYDKSEISNVSDTYLRQLVKEIEKRNEN